MTKDSSDEDDESEEEKEAEEDNDKENEKNGTTEKSDEEVSEQPESEDINDPTDESEEERPRASTKTSSKKKGSVGKARSKKVTGSNKSDSAKSSAKKLAASRAKVDDIDASPKVFSRKKNSEKENKASTPSKSANKEKPGIFHVSLPFLFFLFCSIFCLGYINKKVVAFHYYSSESQIFSYYIDLFGTLKRLWRLRCTLHYLFIPMFYVLGKKVVKGKDKTKEEKSRPSDDELREAICEILKVVDFTTVSIKFIHTNQPSLVGNIISILDI